MISRKNRDRLAAYGALALGAFEAARWVGFWAFLALPVVALLLRLLPDREATPLSPLDAPPGIPQTNWLEDAYGSWLRGTHLSTLAVRYDVDSGFLADELERMDLAAQAVSLGAADARRRRAVRAAHP